MSNGLAGVFVILALLCTAFGVWLFVVAVQYLRVGTQARRRYLELHPRPGYTQGPGSQPPSAGPHYGGPNQ